MEIKKQTRLSMIKSSIKFFFLRLLGRVSIFKGFDVNDGESVVLRRNRKYLQIDNCVLRGMGEVPKIRVVL